jgi:hypothetical protein
MTKTRRHMLMATALTSAGALFVFGAATAPSSASDVRAQLSPDLIAQHCIANGEGSNVEAIFITAAGARIKGSVLCTSEDLKVSVTAPGRETRDHDDSEDEHEEAGDDD